MARCKFFFRNAPGGDLKCRRPRTCSIQPRGGHWTRRATVRSSLQKYFEAVVEDQITDEAPKFYRVRVFEQ